MNEIRVFLSFAVSINIQVSFVSYSSMNSRWSEVTRSRSGRKESPVMIEGER